MSMRGIVAEFVGTFALCFVGIWAIDHASSFDGGAGLLMVAAAHGLVIACMVAATLHISGAQFNPAVSIAVWLAGKQDAKSAAVYIATQLVAGLAASGLLLVFGLTQAQIGAGTPALAEGVSALKGVGVEVVLTFFLMFVIYGSVISGGMKGVAGVFIGGTVALDILAGGPITGAAMNPARHMGPALVAGGEHIGAIWIYWAGPVVGAALAGLVGRFVLEGEGKEG